VKFPSFILPSFFLSSSAASLFFFFNFIIIIFLLCKLREGFGISQVLDLKHFEFKR
jgi:hypothetical protein